MPSLTVNLSAAKFKKQAYAYMLLYLNPIMLYHQAVSIVKKLESRVDGQAQVR